MRGRAARWVLPPARRVPRAALRRAAAPSCGCGTLRGHWDSARGPAPADSPPHICRPDSWECAWRCLGWREGAILWGTACAHQPLQSWQLRCQFQGEPSITSDLLFGSHLVGSRLVRGRKQSANVLANFPCFLSCGVWMQRCASPGNNSSLYVITLPNQLCFLPSSRVIIKHYTSCAQLPPSFSAALGCSPVGLQRSSSEQNICCREEMLLPYGM